MCVTEGHRQAAMTQQFSYCVERHTGLGESRREMMVQVVPAELDGYVCRLEYLTPDCLESRVDRK